MSEGVQIDGIQLERSLLLEESTVQHQLLRYVYFIDQLPLVHAHATLSCADDGVSSVPAVQPAADGIEEMVEFWLLGWCL